MGNSGTLKAHISVDERIGVVHGVVAIAASEVDVNQVDKLL
jgi:hypothetical protein